MRWILPVISLAVGLMILEAAETNTLSDVLTDRPLANVTRASDLMDRDIQDRTGEKIGSVSDLAISLASGKILFVVVSVEGNGEQENRLVSFSASKLEWKDNNLSWKGEQSKLPSMHPFSAGTNGSKDMQFAKALFGISVSGSSGEKVGDVKDLALDWNTERVPFVILSPPGFLKLSSAWHPVPPGSLKFDPDRKILELAMTQDRFIAAPQFHAGGWSNLSDPEWAKQVYAFYGVRGYFEPGLQPTATRTNSLERIYHEPQK